MDEKRIDSAEKWWSFFDQMDEKKNQLRQEMVKFKDQFKPNESSTKIDFKIPSVEEVKFRHNFKDTPNVSCLCSAGAESTTHFLLLCPLFKTHREKLMKTIEPLLQTSTLTLHKSMNYFYMDSNR